MQAISIIPNQTGSARLTDVPEPPKSEGSVLVETIAVGICGTDRELIAGDYGEAPLGEERLIIGHESLARVVEAPTESDLRQGDAVVAIVRRPDPVPCPNCAVGEWDMCRNGQYTECGIKGRHGFMRERFRVEPDFCVKVHRSLKIAGVLLEPTSVVAKAWEQIERIGSRARWEPRKVLVTGAGPVGLMAALLGVQRGLDVCVVDLVKAGPKPRLVRDLGATFCNDLTEALKPPPDIVLECTGVGQLVFDVMQHTAACSIMCLTGISSGGRQIPIDAGQLNRSLVLENDVVFGSVNANRRHYAHAAAALAQADGSWLERVITRRVGVSEWQAALERRPDDVKTVIQFSEV